METPKKKRGPAPLSGMHEFKRRKGPTDAATRAIISEVGWVRFDHVLAALGVSKDWAEEHLGHLPRRRQGNVQFVEIREVSKAIKALPPW
jgi:hypothetical protein